MSIYEICLNSISNGEADRKLGNMAAKIALQNFDYRYATLLVFNSTLYYGVELFLRLFNKNVIVNRGTIEPNFINISRQYVIFGSDFSDLEQLFETELKIKLNGKFIIVCQSPNSNDCEEKEVIKLFWEQRIVDVVFIKFINEKAEGYTYYPISNGECDNINPVKLISSNGSELLTTNYGYVFGMKLNKLNFCPLFVSTFLQDPYMNYIKGKYMGADGELLSIIAYALNTSVKVMLPHRGDGWGFRFKNGTWMGSLADIYEDLANFSMTSAAITLTRFSDFQITRSYYASRVVWVTHPAQLQNEALKLLQPFTYSTRIALITSYLLVIFCAFVVRTDKWSSLCHQTQQEQPLKSVVFYSWMICMGQSLIKLPTKSTLLQITFLWIYYCFIIRTVYQVYLISSLKGIFYEDQIDTIEDAIKADYPFGGGLALQDYYVDYPAVRDKWINVDPGDMLPTVLSIAKGKKFVLAMNGAAANIAMKKYKINIHVLDETIVNSPTVLFLKKHSPLTESLNHVLSKLVASGLPDMLYRKYTTVKTDQKGENEQETLKIVHFSACYVVLLIGFVLSIVFFLLEIYFGKIYKHPMFSPD